MYTTVFLCPVLNPPPLFRGLRVLTFSQCEKVNTAIHSTIPPRGGELLEWMQRKRAVFDLDTGHTEIAPRPHIDDAMVRFALIGLLSAQMLLVPRAARGEIHPVQVRRAIALGVKYLRQRQKSNGSWEEWIGMHGGVTALCTLALLNSGVEPDHSDVKLALKYLRTTPARSTYAVSLQTMAFCAARSERDLGLIQQHVDWLESAQLANGSWSYARSSRTSQGDRSNAQFALLALYEAERFSDKIKINDRTWQRALQHWKSAQNRDGSFGYAASNRKGTGSMTSAGIASLVIGAGKQFELDELSGRTLDCCSGASSSTALQKSLRWIGTNFSVTRNPGHDQNHYLFRYYYLYALERAGRLTGRRFLGGHDWYREGVYRLLQLQATSGRWKLSPQNLRTRGMQEASTALALLFISKGRRPVVIGKLLHGPGNDWDNHPSAVANLTDQIGKAWKHELSWQTVDPHRASVDELLETPVLFISGRYAPLFHDEDLPKLRQYVEQGGFIFAESCCDGTAFDKGFRDLLRKMFPQDEHQPFTLLPEHPVWRFEELVPAKYVGELWGVNVGCRTGIIVSRRDLSCRWQYAYPRQYRRLRRDVQQDVKDATAIGRNVVAYATNRKLRYKYDYFHKANEPVDTSTRGGFKIAQVLHGDRADATPRTLPNLKQALLKQRKIHVSFEPYRLGLGQDEVFDFPLLFLHGREAFSFTRAEREQLRTYLSRGGFLLADSICASEEFVTSFRREMALLFPEKKLASIPAEHPLFSETFGGHELNKVRLRRRERGESGKLRLIEQSSRPLLEGIKQGDRYVVLFSQYDISCAIHNPNVSDCRGYAPDDALKIGINAVLYALLQPGP